MVSSLRELKEFALSKAKTTAPIASHEGDLRGDATLIQAVRGGDVAAFGLLYERHLVAARRLARQLVNSADVDDLAAVGFSKVLTALQNGQGPTESFRAYLLTSIRSVHIDRLRSVLTLTNDESSLDRSVDFVDPSAMNVEHGPAADAFGSLPERWQTVLWHLDVEGQKPADVAPVLDMTPNGVAALAYRAREGLRQAYLQGHLAASDNENCRWAASKLGAYVRSGLSTRDANRVEAHLDKCARCTGLYLELREVNADLGAVLAPALLGPAAVGYLAAGAGATAGAGGALGVLKLVAAGISKVTVEPIKSAGPAGGAAAAVVVAAVAAAAVAAGGGAPSSPPKAAPSVQASVAASEAPTSVEPTETATPSSDAPPTTVAPSIAAPATRQPTPVTQPASTPQPTPSSVSACREKGNILFFGIDLVEDVLNSTLTDGPNC